MAGRLQQGECARHVRRIFSFARLRYAIPHDDPMLAAPIVKKYIIPYVLTIIIP